MTAFLSFTVLGLVIGAGYAVAASGLVLTYSTSRIFNVAHGAIGMVMAFLYWELSENQGLPAWLALFLVVVVIAPLLGAVIERTMMRRLTEASVSVSLVVTVGLMVGLIGAAQAIWPPEGRFVQEFLAGHSIQVAGVVVTAHNMITIAVAIAIAAALYLFLNGTRTGVAMRASVDNRMLLALHGGRPGRVTAASWAIGSALAALGGVLLTPIVQLGYFELTLLVISAYAAAMVGRLQSLPLTFAGALALGLLQSYATGYLPTEGVWTGLRPALPALFLFVVLLALPQARLRVGQIKGIPGVPVPSPSRAAGFGAGLVAIVFLASLVMSPVAASRGALGFIYATVMLSLVLLTGYGGHVSLAQFTFVGVGAVTAAKFGGSSPMALLAAVVVAAIVGALVALPSLRLQGLYLALTTLAFAQLMDKLVFQSDLAFGFNGSLSADRVQFLGLRFDSPGSYLVLTATVFVAVGLFVLAVRRGRYGRMLIAMRDSPAACATLGLDLRWARVGLFAVSAGIAGLAGGLFGGLRQTISATDFQLFESLPLLLLAVVAGATSVTGAALGGMVLMLLPVLQSQFPALSGLVFLCIGIAAVSLGHQPNGVAGYLFQLSGLRSLPARFRGRDAVYAASVASDGPAGPAPQTARTHEEGAAAMAGRGEMSSHGTS